MTQQNKIIATLNRIRLTLTIPKLNKILSGDLLEALYDTKDNNLKPKNKDDLELKKILLNLKSEKQGSKPFYPTYLKPHPYLVQSTNSRNVSQCCGCCSEQICRQNNCQAYCSLPVAQNERFINSRAGQTMSIEKSQNFKFPNGGWVC